MSNYRIDPNDEVSIVRSRVHFLQIHTREVVKKNTKIDEEQRKYSILTSATVSSKAIDGLQQTPDQKYTPVNFPSSYRFPAGRLPTHTCTGTVSKTLENHSKLNKHTNSRIYLHVYTHKLARTSRILGQLMAAG